VVEHVVQCVNTRKTLPFIDIQKKKQYGSFEIWSIREKRKIEKYVFGSGAAWLSLARVVKRAVKFCKRAQPFYFLIISKFRLLNAWSKECNKNRIVDYESSFNQNNGSRSTSSLDGLY